MSASIHELDATLTVCGIKSHLTLTVNYLSLRSYPGDREQPAEPRSVEILSIWRGEHVLNMEQFSSEQLNAIAGEILENQ